MSEVGEGRRRGRVRDAAIDVQVLDAALKLLAVGGVAGMSMDQVAASAGVSKTTVYTRWRNKTELIGAALRHLRLEHQPQLSGDTRKDLITLVVAMRKQYARVGGMSILGSCMLDDTASNGELIHIVRASTVLPRREQFTSVIKAGIASGRLKPDTDPERAVSAIIGAFYADYIAGRSTSGRKWAESIVDIVLEGISQ